MAAFVLIGNNTFIANQTNTQLTSSHLQKHNWHYNVWFIGVRLFTRLFTEIVLIPTFSTSLFSYAPTCLHTCYYWPFPVGRRPRKGAIKRGRPRNPRGASAAVHHLNCRAWNLEGNAETGRIRMDQTYPSGRGVVSGVPMLAGLWRSRTGTGGSFVKASVFQENGAAMFKQGSWRRFWWREKQVAVSSLGE